MDQNAFAPNSFSGSGMVVAQLPYLLQADAGNTIIAVSNGSSARYFDLVGSVYVPHFFVQDTLSYNAGASEFLLTDTLGDKLRFYDFSGLTNQQGQFKSYTDADGNVLAVTSLTADGKPAEVQWSTTVGGSTYTESYLYSYVASGTNAGLLATVTLRRQVNGGAWTVVRQVAYAYYDGVQLYGNAGDLQTATIKDAAGNPLDTKYYRYYTSADAGTIGWVHGLKYLFEPQSYARLAAAVGNPLTATDAQVAPYADDYLEYEPTTRRVTKAVVQGSGCSSCAGGQGTFTYSYTSSSNPSGYNSWATKTVETLPDGNQNIVYTNYAAEVMLKVFQSGSQQWDTFAKYDTAGRVILKANPSAVSGYNDSFADLLDQTQVGDYGYLNATSGLIEVTDYYATTTAGETTAGGVAGYWQDTKLQQGKTGPLILQATVQYFAHTAGGATVAPMATQTVYRNTDGTGAETTSYSYTWFSGTTRKQSVAVSLPTISAAQNGPGTADVQTTFFDTYGRPVWTKDGDGFINYTTYDPATGAVNKTITDVDTTRTGDFQNLPAGWGTPAGGGLHLITQREVDILGRTTKLTDPNTNVTYTVYNDPNHEVRTYPGWQAATNTTTGPTQAWREDRQFSTGYTEALTMSAAPAVSGGRPTGGEAVSSVQTLSRRYVSSGGQMVRADAYFNLTGLTYSTALYLGTAGTNYYSTLSDYDVRGRPNRTQLPTGTIKRTVYDGLDRVVSTWVGTNDTPASGYWSPTNNTPPSNMVQVTGNVYDSGGVGDGNLTQATQYPGGGAAARVTAGLYDWRDRLVLTKQGVQATENDGTHRPIFYRVYDNLGEVTASDRYDGDGLDLTNWPYTNGVPNPPSASLLRTHTVTAYDDQQRVYLTSTFSVDQGNGTVSANSLNTNTWYDHRGNVIKTSPPGGVVTKAAYDGARRVVRTYTTDEVASPSWTEAGTVANNNVLSQTEAQYDAAGNVLFTIRRDRFHNETTLGALGTPTTAPLARVSYVAGYYDLANRLTTQVHLGTNGGTVLTARPGTAPDRTNPVLRTDYGYQADAVQQVTLTGSPTGGTFKLTFNGQTTAPIAYNATAAAVQSALQSLPSIGSGNALVAGPTGGPWLVRFAGTLAGTALANMTGDGSGLTGGTMPSVAVATTSQGGDTDRVQTVTDPRALVMKTDYDYLNRKVRTVENFVAFAPSNNADKTTEYTYDGSNHVLTLVAKLSNTSQETTTYTYGVSGSVISSNDLLASTVYPDNGQPHTESYAYNALGEVVSKTDRNGDVHSYTYDVLGRQTSDAVTAFGTGVDQAVKRIDTAYDTGGRPFRFTSYNSATLTDPVNNQVNQVQWTFNGLEQLITETQVHGNSQAPVISVQYAYSFVSAAGGPNHSRLTQIVYPNGRIVNYNYSALDDALSRPTSLSDSSATLESYTYLGLGTVVKRAHPEPGVDLSYISQPGGSTDGGDQYTGLDRFGRVIDQYWVQAGQATDRFQYTYDQDGNRLTRTNVVNSAFNEQYGYDNLNQLTSFTRGTHTQSWGLDALGNWGSFTTDGGTPQTRTHNLQNQIASISGFTTPTYDNNGNTTTDQNNKTLVYDAWNRLVRYNGTTTVTYAYDALNRRVSGTSAGVTTDVYYSSSWQVLEERISGVTQAQYVWSPVYVDAMVERDVGTQRLYVQQDANWNVTAIVGKPVATWVVQERYAYDSYGLPSFLNPTTWAQLTNSQFSWIYLHQGGRYDTTSGLYYFRNRDYSPTLGRWVQPDPLMFSAGDNNFYRYVGNNPTTALDATGLRYTGEGGGEDKKDCKCCSLTIAHSKKFVVEKGRAALLIYLLTTYTTEGTGDPSQCEFHRTKKSYSWHTEDGKKKVDVDDKEPKPDGDKGTDQLGDEHATTSEKDGKWTRIDVDRPGTIIRGDWKAGLPAGREVTYRYWVINSDKTKSCDKSWTLKFEVDKNGDVTGGPKD
jgi:RHS repeat-associated protein